MSEHPPKKDDAPGHEHGSFEAQVQAAYRDIFAEEPELLNDEERLEQDIAEAREAARQYHKDDLGKALESLKHRLRSRLDEWRNRTMRTEKPADGAAEHEQAAPSPREEAPDIDDESAMRMIAEIYDLDDIPLGEDEMSMVLADYKSNLEDNRGQEGEPETLRALLEKELEEARAARVKRQEKASHGASAEQAGADERHDAPEEAEGVRNPAPAGEGQAERDIYSMSLAELVDYESELDRFRREARSRNEDWAVNVFESRMRAVSARMAELSNAMPKRGGYDGEILDAEYEMVGGEPAAMSIEDARDAVLDAFDSLGRREPSGELLDALAEVLRNDVLAGKGSEAEVVERLKSELEKRPNFLANAEASPEAPTRNEPEAAAPGAAGNEGAPSKPLSVRADNVLYNEAIDRMFEGQGYGGRDAEGRRIVNKKDVELARRQFELEAEERGVSAAELILEELERAAPGTEEADRLRRHIENAKSAAAEDERAKSGATLSNRKKKEIIKAIISKRRGGGPITKDEILAERRSAEEDAERRGVTVAEVLLERVDPDSFEAGLLRNIIEANRSMAEDGGREPAPVEAAAPEAQGAPESIPLEDLRGFVERGLRVAGETDIDDDKVDAAMQELDTIARANGITPAEALVALFRANGAPEDADDLERRVAESKADEGGADLAASAAETSLEDVTETEEARTTVGRVFVQRDSGDEFEVVEEHQGIRGTLVTLKSRQDGHTITKNLSDLEAAAAEPGSAWSEKQPAAAADAGTEASADDTQAERSPAEMAAENRERAASVPKELEHATFEPFKIGTDPIVSYAARELGMDPGDFKGLYVVRVRPADSANPEEKYGAVASYHDLLVFRSLIKPEHIGLFTDETGGGKRGIEVNLPQGLLERLDDPNDPLHGKRDEFLALVEAVRTEQEEDAYVAAAERLARAQDANRASALSVPESHESGLDVEVMESHDPVRARLRSYGVSDDDIRAAGILYIAPRAVDAKDPDNPTLDFHTSSDYHRFLRMRAGLEPDARREIDGFVFRRKDRRGGTLTKLDVDFTNPDFLKRFEPGGDLNGHREEFFNYINDVLRNELEADRYADAVAGEAKKYGEALDIVREGGAADPFVLQQRMRIGNKEARKLIEEMKRRGAVDPSTGEAVRDAGAANAAGSEQAPGQEEAAAAAAPAPSPEQDASAAAGSPEARPTRPVSARMAARFENTLGIKRDVLESIPGFDALTDAQQRLVLENMQQLRLGQVSEMAGNKYREDVAEASRGIFRSRSRGRFERFAASAANVVNPEFYRTMWLGLSKHYQIAKREQAASASIKEGGAESQREMLAQLVRGMREFDIDCVEVNGTIEVNYVSPSELAPPGTDPTEERRIMNTVDAFNIAARELSKLPYEWSLDSARLVDRARYRLAANKYNRLRRRLADIKLSQTGMNKNAAAAFVNGVDEKMKLNQFFNTNPNAEKRLTYIDDKKIWKQVLRGITRERGLYLVGGTLVRTAGILTIGAMAVPAAAAGMGGLMGRKRAFEAIRDRERRLRRGEDMGEMSTADDERRIAKLERKMEKLEAKRGLSDRQFTKREKTLANYRKEIAILRADIERTKQSFDKTFEGADALGRKITSLVDRIENEDDAAKRSELVKKLNTRLDYTRARIDNGCVRFGGDRGDASEAALRLTQQIDLVQAMSRGEVVIAAESGSLSRGFDRARRRSDRDRMHALEAEWEKDKDERLEAQKLYAWKETQKGARWGAGMAAAGWAVRNVVFPFFAEGSSGGSREGSSGSGHAPEEEKDEPKSPEAEASKKEAGGKWFEAGHGKVNEYGRMSYHFRSPIFSAEYDADLNRLRLGSTSNWGGRLYDSLDKYWNGTWKWNPATERYELDEEGFYAKRLAERQAAASQPLPQDKPIDPGWWQGAKGARHPADQFGNLRLKSEETMPDDPEVMSEDEMAEQQAAEPHERQAAGPEEQEPARETRRQRWTRERDELRRERAAQAAAAADQSPEGRSQSGRQAAGPEEQEPARETRRQRLSREREGLRSTRSGTVPAEERGAGSKPEAQDGSAAPEKNASGTAEASADAAAERSSKRLEQLIEKGDTDARRLVRHMASIDEMLKDGIDRAEVSRLQSQISVMERDFNEQPLLVQDEAMKRVEALRNALRGRKVFVESLDRRQRSDYHKMFDSMEEMENAHEATKRAFYRELGKFGYKEKAYIERIKNDPDLTVDTILKARAENLKDEVDNHFTKFANWLVKEFDLEHAPDKNVHIDDFIRSKYRHPSNDLFGGRIGPLRTRGVFDIRIGRR